MGKRAGIDERHTVAFRDFRGVGVPVTHKTAAEFFRAQREGEEVGLYAVCVSVGEKNLHAFDIQSHFFRQGQTVAVARHSVKVFVQDKLAESCRPVAEEKDVITLRGDV